MPNMLVRIPEPLHALAKIAAAAQRTTPASRLAGKRDGRPRLAHSLNAYICEAIQAAVLREIQRDPAGPVAAAAKQLAARS